MVWHARDPAQLVRARKCWRVRKTIGGKTRSFYVGRGTSGPSDESGRAKARLEAERLIREAEVEASEDAERWDESLTLSKGMKIMADERICWEAWSR